jgi:hypothetical protein
VFVNARGGKWLALMLDETIVFGFYKFDLPGRSDLTAEGFRASCVTTGTLLEEQGC